MPENQPGKVGEGTIVGVLGSLNTHGSAVAVTKTSSDKSLGKHSLMSPNLGRSMGSHLITRPRRIRSMASPAAASSLPAIIRLSWCKESFVLRSAHSHSLSPNGTGSTTSGGTSRHSPTLEPYSAVACCFASSTVWCQVSPPKDPFSENLSKKTPSGRWMMRSTFGWGSRFLRSTPSVRAGGGPANCRPGRANPSDRHATMRAVINASSVTEPETRGNSRQLFARH